MLGSRGHFRILVDGGAAGGYSNLQFFHAICWGAIMKRWFVVLAVALLGIGFLAAPALSAGQGGCGFKSSKPVKDVATVEKPITKAG